MASDPNAPRSRRALLTAAAGAAGAVAASAALPLSVAAVATTMQTETANTSGADTSLTDNGADSTAFAANATGTGAGYGLAGTALGAAGVFAWSVSSPTTYWTDPTFDPAFTNYTGVFGSSPAGDGTNTFGTGVWGDSPDTGVLGTGGTGVEGCGYWGVRGDANGNAGSIGVLAVAPNTSSLALNVSGKAHFSRAGRNTIGAGKAGIKIYLAGVSSGSKIFAVLQSNRSGRWVRAVVPAAGSFSIFLNTTVTSSTYVTWFVLD
jgi:hypothetical protein